MSVHVIYKGNGGAKMMRPVLTREEYLKLRNGGFQKDNVARIRQGDEALKSSLVQMNYSCLPNDDGTLKGSKRMSTTVGMDIDHIEPADMPKVRERILGKKDELGLGMLEESARGKGYHLVFKRRPDMSQEENLKWASELLNVAYDAKAKDITRVFFTTTEQELIYLDDAIFETTEQVLTNTNLTNLTNSCAQEKNSCNSCNSCSEDNPSNPSNPCSNKKETPCSFPSDYHGIPFADIIAKYWEVNNRGFEPTQGDRDTLTYQLACDLRHICGRNFEWLDQVIPCYDGFPLEEKRAKIKSALASEFNGFPQRLRNTLSAFAVNKNQNENHEPLTNNREPALPPEMPKKLPKVVQLLVSRTPDVYKPAVAHAIFPSLGAHLWKVRFPYIDNVMHEATFMNVLMAGTGAGKDCISQPINHIMADIRKRDAENLKREADWKKEVNSKGSNKDKRQRPEGLVIQEVDPDMTNPAFVMRMAEADEHFLYTKMNEIDQFDALRGSARGSQQFQIMCLAFDPDNRYGQTRVGTQSVTEKVCIRFNWNAATTIQKGQRYFRNVLTDGPISRINFCTIPEREIGADMPVYGTYDSSFDEELRPFIDRLCRAAGVIDCPQAFRLAKKLKDECAEFARLSQSRVYENLSFRANVIAHLKACVLYICNDYKWSKEIEDFVRWSLKYDLFCKMTFFGEAIENANRSVDEQTGRRGPRNLLKLLPDEFTVHDADLIRQANGMDTRGTRNMLSQWVHRGYLLQMTDDSFKKVKSEK